MRRGVAAVLLLVFQPPCAAEATCVYVSKCANVARYIAYLYMDAMRAIIYTPVHNRYNIILCCEAAWEIVGTH